MHDTHGVVIPESEWNMFIEWDRGDLISPWELERDNRIAAVQATTIPTFMASATTQPGPARGNRSWRSSWGRALRR